VVCQTAHPRDFFGERDCAACRWTDSFIDVKQSTSDQDSSTARGPKQESVVRQVPGDQRTVARARGMGKSVKLSRRRKTSRVVLGQRSPESRQLTAGFQSPEACLRLQHTGRRPSQSPSPRPRTIDNDNA
jgi:hypothetical protein